MKVRKSFKAVVPSTAYGNITFEIELTEEVPIKDTAKMGTILDKLIKDEYLKFSKEMESLGLEAYTFPKK